ncbi:MAG: 50S ribosomal protein L3 [Candidatus Taylorbacteria bacterium RIFCSPHIGHO2_01_FULL_46_22b]|uniref:50S ribosomal protein L3 n=1 Tax=Candidatus Taylorbacteria bacterium RIFCSPHIGHO2_01_FULL_46_22b TaxID=1802301 RepID=A0A1G2M2Q9_9BACT|nr:MAG: 50S ribosomal protein L3 [Candidatus Taylorbacteria bacterium RIFCSPHIGHO2_01_FULL_46_22b]
MKFILGKKVNMTQVFQDDGTVEPVTIIQAGPVTVTQTKNKESDGYSAVQVGFVPQPKNETEKAAHKRYTHVKEFRTEKASVDLKVGDSIDVSSFAVNDTVEVSAISKGKGFQGVVKRHGFGGGRRTHGQKHSEREPGAIGGRGRAGGRVSLGMRMAGRMGADRITIKNLKIIQVDAAGHTLLVSGAIPGRRGTIVEIISR